MDAYILAGGEGTRLRERLSPGKPKPMAAVAGRPFLEYPLELLRGSGRISRIIICARYGWEDIYAHLGGDYKGLPIFYHIEPQASGTGGALASAFRLSRKSDICLAMNGDCWWEGANIGEYIDAFLSSGADAGMALAKITDAGRFGAVETHEGRVSRFIEKGQGEALINAGLYLLPQDIFTRGGQSFPPAFSLEKELFAPLKLSVFPYALPGRFIDIGVPSDYDRAQHTVMSRFTNN